MIWSINIASRASASAFLPILVSIVDALDATNGVTEDAFGNHIRATSN